MHKLQILNVIGILGYGGNRTEELLDANWDAIAGHEDYERLLGTPVKISLLINRPKMPAGLRKTN